MALMVPHKSLPGGGYSAGCYFCRYFAGVFRTGFTVCKVVRRTDKQVNGGTEE